MIAVLFALAVQCADGSPPPCRAAARPGPDPGVIAVLPFRVSGADSSLAEGLAELLAVEFTGEGGPRSADMGSVIRSWRAAGGGARDAIGLPQAQAAAARIGAGRFLSASVVGTGRRLSVSAQIRRTADGRVESSAGPVRGSEDSLPVMVQRVAAQLLGMSSARHALAETAPEAVRAYVDGLAAYRRADWAPAAERFLRALEVDSTFAPAALVYIMCSGWLSVPGDATRVMRLAWTFRHRLDPQGRVLLPSVLGARYPEPSTVIEDIEAHEAAIRVAPDNAAVWFRLGDDLLHVGSLAVPDAFTRAMTAFERAQALDSGLSEIPLHLSSLALTLEDPAKARFQAAQIRRRAPGHPWAALQRYEEAIAHGDGRRVADSLTAVLPTLDATVLGMFPFIQFYPSQPLDTLLLLGTMGESVRRASSTNERYSAAFQLAALRRNLGQMALADSALQPLSAVDRNRYRVITALVSGRQEAAASAAALQLGSAVGALDGLPRQRAACILGVWLAMTRDAQGAAELAPVLQSSARLDLAAWCRPLVDAAAAMASGAPGAPALLARADSIVGLGQPTHQGWEGMVLARLWLLRGDTASALRALRRDHVVQHKALFYLSDYLRLGGALAAATGDVGKARRAYRHYLNLRLNPDTSLVAQRDSVRAEAARLDPR